MSSASFYKWRAKFGGVDASLIAEMKDLAEQNRRLAQNIFETIEEAQEQATEWLWTYNNDRPNRGIGGITPAMKLKMAA